MAASAFRIAPPRLRRNELHRPLGVWLAAWLCALCLLCAPSGARADALDVTFEWSGPGECGRDADVVAALRRSVRVREGRTLLPLVARGEVSVTASGYSLHLKTERRGLIGERTLEGKSCDELLRATVLVLALALGEDVELVEPAGSRTVVPVEVEPAPPRRSSARTTPIEPSIEATASSDPDVRADHEWLGFGQLEARPSLFGPWSFGLRSGAGFRRDALELHLALAVTPYAYRPGRAGVELSLVHVAAAAEACGRIERSLGALSFCAGPELGVVRSRATGALATAEDTSALALIGATVTASKRLSVVELGLSAGLDLTLRSSDVRDDLAGSLHRFPAAAARIAVGASASAGRRSTPRQ